MVPRKLEYKHRTTERYTSTLLQVKASNSANQLLEESPKLNSIAPLQAFPPSLFKFRIFLPLSFCSDVFGMFEKLCLQVMIDILHDDDVVVILL
jgi:hypothetical protein